MGNYFSGIVRDFIAESARSGVFLFNLLRNILSLPLLMRSFPVLFRHPIGSGITYWESTADIIGTVQIRWFEDASKCILYVIAYNAEIDNVVTLAAFQAKRFASLTEVHMYYPSPYTDEVVGIRFRTGIDIHELKNMFTQRVHLFDNVSN